MAKRCQRCNGKGFIQQVSTQFKVVVVNQKPCYVCSELTYAASIYDGNPTWDGNNNTLPREDDAPAELAEEWVDPE